MKVVFSSPNMFYTLLKYVYFIHISMDFDMYRLNKDRFPFLCLMIQYIILFCIVYWHFRDIILLLLLIMTLLLLFYLSIYYIQLWGFFVTVY